MDPTIDATGATDVTAAVQAFVTSLAPQTTVLLPDTGATYRIEGTVVLGADVDGIEILGPTSGTAPLFYATTDGADSPPVPGYEINWPLNRSQFLLKECSNVHLRNFRIRGANPPQGGLGLAWYLSDPAYNLSYESQHGIHFQGCTNCSAREMDVREVWGDFYYVGYSNGTGDAQFIDVLNNVGEGAGRQGIAVTAGRDVLIEGNDIRYIRRSAFDVEPNFSYATCQRVTVRGNTIAHKRLSFMAAKGFPSTVADITVENNVLGPGATMNMEISPAARASNWTIRNNVSTQQFGSSFPLIIVRDVDGLVVTGNTSPFQARSPLTPAFVKTERCCGITVSGNTATGAGVQTMHQTDNYDCTVPNVAPIARFTYAVDALTVTITNTSTDPDGPPPAGLVDWGDGTTEPIDAGAELSHTYASAGTRSVSLVANDGEADSAPYAVAITTVAPGVTVFRRWDAGDALPAGSTFTGPAGATYHDALGAVAAVAANTLRDAHHIPDPTGVLVRTALLESARTNLLGFSSEFGSWTASSATVTADATTAPDGSTTADLVVPAATTAFHGVSRIFTAADGTTVTGQVYARDRLDTPYLLIGLTCRDGTNKDAVVRLADGAVISQPSGYTVRTQVLGAGWVWASITGSVLAGTTTPRLRAHMQQSPTVGGFLGVPAEHGLYFWRAGVQASATPKSGVTTVGGTTATLATDALTFAGVDTGGAAATLYRRYFDLATWTWAEQATAYTDDATYTPTLDRAYLTVAWIEGTRTAEECRAILGVAP